MNPITTLEIPPRNMHSRNILSKEGFICSLISLEPDAEMARPVRADPGEQILCVIEGEVIVQLANVSTLLAKEAALLVPKDESYTLTTRTGAKLLKIDVPPRQVVTPQILSFDT